MTSQGTLLGMSKDRESLALPLPQAPAGLTGRPLGNRIVWETDMFPLCHGHFINYVIAENS